MATFMTVTGLAGAIAALAAVYFALQTARLAAAQRRAGERNHRLRELREIAGLVEGIFWDAKQAPFSRRYEGDVPYRCPEQNSLAQLLAGLDVRLIECSRLAEAETPFRASEIAISARLEVREVIEAEHDAARPPRPGPRVGVATLLSGLRALGDGLASRLRAPAFPRRRGGRSGQAGRGEARLLVDD